MRTIYLDVTLTEPDDTPELPWDETLESMLRLLLAGTSVGVRVTHPGGIALSGNSAECVA